MKWTEARVVFQSDHREFAVDLISNIFYEFGLNGVVVETPDFEAVDDIVEKMPPPAGDNAVIGYFIKNGKEGLFRDSLEKSLLRLQNDHRIRTRITYRNIDEQDWAENWKTFFQPQKIGLRIVVKPTWRQYSAEPDDIILEINPGMAFGTGTHPTTALCLKMIEKYLRPGQAFLDVGTGSGILMLAAAKLGAGAVWGVDHDETAVEIARKNLELNRIEARRFNVICGHLLDGIHRRFDIVVANILTEPVLALLKNLTNVLEPEGIFIASGISEENTNQVVEALKKSGYDILEAVMEEKWSTVAAASTTF